MKSARCGPWLIPNATNHPNVLPKSSGGFNQTLVHLCEPRWNTASVMTSAGSRASRFKEEIDQGPVDDLTTVKTAESPKSAVVFGTVVLQKSPMEQQPQPSRDAKGNLVEHDPQKTVCTSESRSLSLRRDFKFPQPVRQPLASKKDGRPLTSGGVSRTPSMLSAKKLFRRSASLVKRRGHQEPLPPMPPWPSIPQPIYWNSERNRNRGGSGQRQPVQHANQPSVDSTLSRFSLSSDDRSAAVTPKRSLIKRVKDVVVRGVKGPRLRSEPEQQMERRGPCVNAIAIEEVKTTQPTNLSPKENEMDIENVANIIPHKLRRIRGTIRRSTTTRSQRSDSGVQLTLGQKSREDADGGSIKLEEQKKGTSNDSKRSHNDDNVMAKEAWWASNKKVGRL
jgi:hypothetical protein